jgi:glutathione S-transferase
VIEPAAAARPSGGNFNAGAVGWGTYETMLNATEAAVGAGPWLLGDRFTMADVILGGTLRFMLTFKMIEPRSAFTDYVQRLDARPTHSSEALQECRGGAEPASNSKRGPNPDGKQSLREWQA